MTSELLVQPNQIANLSISRPGGEDRATCSSESHNSQNKVPPTVGKTPSVWSKIQFEKWTMKYPWIESDLGTGRLGCSTCKNAKLLVETTQGVHLSDQWLSSKIDAVTGRKLKEKVYKHVQSAAHKEAEKILRLSQEGRLESAIIDQTSRLFAETIRIFRTAYAVAKNDLPFTVHSSLVQLQELNGIEMGSIHRSDHSCAAIIKSISSLMKRSLCQQIVQNVRFVSIMLDEATLFKTSVIILYLRTCLPGSIGIATSNRGVENVFLGLAEAEEGVNAQGIIAAVEDILEKCKIDESFMAKSLIGICTDGASVMTGRESGVASSLARKFGTERMELFHCLAHRLELAVDDALKAVTATNHFQAFVQKLYSLYSQSPKNSRELKEAAAATETELLKVTSIFTVRWVSSSFRVVRAIWRDFAALHHHLQNAAMDASRTSLERTKFEHLARQLGSVNFIQDMALMKDILRELRSASLVLQKRNTSVCGAIDVLRKTVTIITAIKESGGGKSMQKAQILKVQVEPVFKGVRLNPRKAAINPQQFIQAIIDSLQRRFPDSDSTLFNDLRVLESSNWPTGDELVLFGEASVLRLAKRLDLPGREVIENYRDYKDGKQPGPQLCHLLDAAETYPATSAECERGFSAMNNTATDKRNCLAPDTISNMLFIKLNGPPLEEFKPEPFVRKWLTEGHRQSTSWKPGRNPEPPRIERQPLYSLVMPK